MADLGGKAIIVTGGGSGIGRAAALHIARSGSAVLVADRDEASAQCVAAEIIANGGHAIARHTDVTREDEVAAMVVAAVAAFGKLDGPPTCAGGPGNTVPLHDLSFEQWQRCIDVNLTSAFFCLKHQIPAMLAVGGGSAVMISSTVAIKAQPMHSEYAASKAGILALVRSAAFDYGKQNIRVNAILPGPVDTPMLRVSLDANPGIEEIVAAQPMLGRIGKPAELGAAIGWLLSDEASFVTGMGIPVDGGQSAH